MKYSIILIAALAAGCSEAPQAVADDSAPMLFPSDLRVSGPDQFGVVCYTFGSRAVSCVQAMVMVATPKQDAKP